jgi:hypothetical protein
MGQQHKAVACERLPHRSEYLAHGDLVGFGGVRFSEERCTSLTRWRATAEAVGCIRASVAEEQPQQNDHRDRHSH